VTAPRIVVVGLGPGDPDLVTAGTLAAIEAVPHRFLRTEVHPSAHLVRGAATFDHHYEMADTFDEVYRRIVADLVAAASQHGTVLYAVPGSPRVLERTVDLLDAEAGAGRVALDVLPALSFVDLAWVRLGIDPYEQGVRLVDAHRFDVAAAGERGPLLVAHCHNRRVLSDVKLAVDDPPATRWWCCSAWACPTSRSPRWRGPTWTAPSNPTTSPRSTCPSWPSRSRARWPPSWSWWPPCGPSAPGMPSRPTAPSPATSWRRAYEVLEALDAVGDGGPDTDPEAYAHLRRSWATCCSRSSSTPPSPPRPGRSGWPTWPAASTRSWCTATRTCSPGRSGGRRR
jgi:hypothetical protein